MALFQLHLREPIPDIHPLMHMLTIVFQQNTYRSTVSGMSALHIPSSFRSLLTTSKRHLRSTLTITAIKSIIIHACLHPNNISLFLQINADNENHHWTGHMLRNESLLLDIIEGRMKGRHRRGRRRLQMLHMLAKDGYVAMNWEAEDRWRWSQRKSCQKPAT